MKYECDSDGGNLCYESEVAAPGSGQTWRCPECGTAYCVKGNSVTKWDEVGREEEYDYSSLDWNSGWRYGGF